MTERMYELFKAARQDAPTPESRAAMWTGIDSCISAASLSSLGASSNGSAFAAAKAAIMSSKLVLGLVLGASLTVGVAATLVAINVAGRDARPKMVEAQPVAMPRTLDRPAPIETLSAERRAVIAGHAVAAPDVIELGKKDEPVTTTPSHTSTVALSEHDRLAREARMVSEARGALHRGEPDIALRIVRAARAQPGARMVPEELTVEAQALRAAGDDEGAKRIEANLASQFPDHSLSH
jgi:hypothetical protein